MGMLQRGRAAMAASGPTVPLVQAGAENLPFADASFDIVCSAFGAVPFVADSARVMREVARVLRPGGRWVFSVNHPMRWIFPDDPGEPGLVAMFPYFDRTPYVEVDATGRATYAEHHRTVGDRVRELVAAGLEVYDIVEPEWPEHLDREWGQWSPLRGRSSRAPPSSAAANPTDPDSQPAPDSGFGVHSSRDRNSRVRLSFGSASTWRGSPASTTTPPSMNTS